MQTSAVAVVRCESHRPEVVKTALRRAFELLGGLERFLPLVERVLLKPNLVSGRAPERAVNTHPAILEGMIRILGRAGIRLALGASPGTEKPRRAAEKAGLLNAAEDYGVRSRITGAVKNQYGCVTGLHKSALRGFPRRSTTAAPASAAAAARRCARGEPFP